MNKSAVLQAWQGHSKCLHCNVRKLALFADLNQNDFDLIHQPITEFDYDAGEVIYAMTDTPDYVYTIRSGLVKLVHDLANGTYRIVRILKQGDVAGIEALNGTAYLQNAVTLLPTSVCRIPVTEIERLNRESPRITKQLTARWYQAVSDADIWLSELTSGHSRRRIASFLLHLDDNKQAEQFYIPTREDIGAILGITTETASRIIAEFRRNGWISIDGSKANINRSFLQELVLSY
ncbi:MAG: Crp/Fnr family transcriptional regulator [Gammaproteobacteria bacterium]|nr:Crp/Fnr family transcriptional regulator [Gammaproteobacteria bacterium]